VAEDAIGANTADVKVAVRPEDQAAGVAQAAAARGDEFIEEGPCPLIIPQDIIVAAPVADKQVGIRTRSQGGHRNPNQVHNEQVAFEGPKRYFFMFSAQRRSLQLVT